MSITKAANAARRDSDPLTIVSEIGTYYAHVIYNYRPDRQHNF